MSNEGRLLKLRQTRKKPKSETETGRDSAQIESKHKHREVTGEHECKNNWMPETNN